MFPELAYNASKRINQIQTDLQTREKLKQQNKSVSIIDVEISSNLKYLDNDLDQIDQELKSYSINQNCNLMAKEIQKRKNLYNELAQKRLDIKRKIESNHLKQLQNQLIQSKQNKRNYESFGQVDALKMHGEITDRQDEQLSKINEKVMSIKYSSQNLNKQIKEQNGMIDQLDEDAENANQAMLRLKQKMNLYLEQSSSWKLMLILTLEILVFVFVVAI